MVGFFVRRWFLAWNSVDYTRAKEALVKFNIPFQKLELINEAEQVAGVVLIFDCIPGKYQILKKMAGSPRELWLEGERKK